MNLYKGLVSQSVELISWRHNLHRHPELSFSEYRTSDFIAGKLQSFGLEPVAGVGGTGIVTVIDSGKPGLSIGLRADIDALPMSDESGLPYASNVEGQAHACGHDGHTVTMLGVAQYLAVHRPNSGRIVMIFQPAEETAQGARAMLNDHMLKRFPLDEVYAFHNMPALPTGKAAVEIGTTLNGAGLWEVEIEGVGGHGASFFTTVDPLQAAARLVAEISSLVGRYIDPAERALITVGKLHAGTAANIIPPTATVSGTLRAQTVEMMTRLRSLLERTCRGVAELTDCKVTCGMLVEVPPCVNAAEQSDVAARACEHVLGENNVTREMKPLPFTDDFAHFLNAVPGAYVFVGQDSEMCHHPAYDFDDNLLSVAGSIMLSIVDQRLEIRS